MTGFSPAKLELLLGAVSKISQDESFIIIYFIVGFIIGFILGWYFYKFFVYVSAAFVGFLLGATFGLTTGDKSTIWIFGILFAAVAIYLIYKFFDIFVIIQLSLPFILLLFLITGGVLIQLDFDSVPFATVVFVIKEFRFIHHIPHFSGDYLKFNDALGYCIKYNYFNYIMYYITYLGLSLVYQIHCKIKTIDSAETISNKQILKNTILISIGFSTILYIVTRFQNAFYPISMNNDFNLAHYFLFSYSQWPLVLLLFYYFVKKLFHNERFLNFIYLSKVNKKIALVFLSLIIFPLSYIIVTAPKYVRSIDKYEYRTIEENFVGNYPDTEKEITDPFFLTVPFKYALSVYGNIFTLNSYNFSEVQNVYPGMVIQLDNPKTDKFVYNDKMGISYVIKLFQLIFLIVLLPIGINKISKLLWLKEQNELELSKNNKQLDNNLISNITNLFKSLILKGRLEVLWGKHKKIIIGGILGIALIVIGLLVFSSSSTPYKSILPSQISNISTGISLNEFKKMFKNSDFREDEMYGGGVQINLFFELSSSNPYYNQWTLSFNSDKRLIEISGANSSIYSLSHSDLCANMSKIIKTLKKSGLNLDYESLYTDFENCYRIVRFSNAKHSKDSYKNYEVEVKNDFENRRSSGYRQQRSNYSRPFTITITCSSQ